MVLWRRYGVPGLMWDNTKKTEIIAIINETVHLENLWYDLSVHFRTSFFLFGGLFRIRVSWRLYLHIFVWRGAVTWHILQRRDIPPSRCEGESGPPHNGGYETKLLFWKAIPHVYHHGRSGQMEGVVTTSVTEQSPLSDSVTVTRGQLLPSRYDGVSGHPPKRWLRNKLLINSCTYPISQIFY